MEKTTTVEAVKHADIRGKELFYLKITKGQKQVIINVGDKTYNSVKDLDKEPEVNEDQLKLIEDEQQVHTKGKVGNRSVQR